MKLIYNISSFILIAVLASGCTTTEKFSVTAPIDTKIFTPYQTESPAAVTSATNNTVDMEVPSDMYCGYLLAKAQNYPFDIPMGLDYKQNSHGATKLATGTGVGLLTVSATLALTSVLLVADNDDETQTTGACVALGSAAGVGIGGGLWAMGQNRMRQTAYDYNFGYDSKQVFNIPPLSVELLHPNPSKQELANNSVAKSERKKASSGTKSQTSSDVVISGTKAKKQKSDHSSKIEGNYSGTAKLFAGNKMEDSFSNITIEIIKIDKNHVKLRILESGEDFFETPLLLTVAKDSKGGYKLTMDNLKGVECSISKAGNLTFRHSQVIIDEDLYTLTVSAKK